MTDQHIKGAISKAEGEIKEGVGKVIGDKELEAKGEAQELHGKAQGGLGDVEDAAHDVGHDRD